MGGPQRSQSGTSDTQAPFKFPPYMRDAAHADDDALTDSERGSMDANRLSNGVRKLDQWQPRRQSNDIRRHAQPLAGRGRSRQKSLGEAIRGFKERRGSVSEGAHELAEALKAPVSPKLVVYPPCLSTSTTLTVLVPLRHLVHDLHLLQRLLKVHPHRLPQAHHPHSRPVRLRLELVYHIILARAPLSHHPDLHPALKAKIRRPSREIIVATLPLTLFQIGGHIMNSDAMARIPVSLVHTIKGLSPLFTVLAYRFIFRIHYSIPTYLSLIPLTAGVIMACSANLSGNLIGLLYAFGSALLFVTQNIVSKRIFNEAALAEAQAASLPTPLKDGAPLPARALKPDKLNLLCYSSGLALLLTLPLWMWTEGYVLIRDLLHHGTVPLSERPDALDHGRLTLEFFFNGTFHFAQSLVAFILLSMVSPVTYSVASLIKRVFVITFAIVYFGSPMTRIQAAGIALTFLGLYLYDRTNDANRADRRARLLNARHEAMPPLLPLANSHAVTNGPPSALLGVGGDGKGFLPLAGATVACRADVRAQASQQQS
ncbi:hypothetical protein MRB53_038442 [Persea americana]|nr:hypothetical protein MRB53_038442 [Persea americana]